MFAQLDKPADFNWSKRSPSAGDAARLAALGEKNAVKLGGTRMRILEGNINKDHNSKPIQLASIDANVRVTTTTYWVFLHRVFGIEKLRPLFQLPSGTQLWILH